MRTYFEYAAFASLSPATSPVAFSIASSNLVPSSHKNFEIFFPAVSFESAAIFALSENICDFMVEITS